MNPIVSVHNVSKRFVIHHERLRSFQDVLVNLFRPRSGGEDFWALRDVAFEANPGETLGIVGRNGSGKSTLLKIISRIYEPSVGSVTVRGKVSALLELGAGFHPDLSGRDNVFLNGSLLGISRKEMRKRFDQIVAFSELDQFIDTPVRHYSSGMYLRLAFAVAINVNADLLIADEVLAVGDQGFQAKCLNELATMRRNGTSILLVTHQMSTVQTICDRAVWLNHGHVAAYGSPVDVVGRYEEIFRQTQSPTTDVNAPEDGAVRLQTLRIADETGYARNVFDVGEPLILSITYRHHPGFTENVGLRVEIRRQDGLLLHVADSLQHQVTFDGSGNVGTAEIRYDSLPLPPGAYNLHLAIYSASDPANVFQRYDSAQAFHVHTRKPHLDGLLALRHHWGGSLTERRSENDGSPAQTSAASSSR